MDVSSQEVLPPSLARVADAVARGLSDKEIAAEIGAPLATVRTYVRRVYSRLGVHSRVALILRWSQRNQNREDQNREG